MMSKKVPTCNSRSGAVGRLLQSEGCNLRMNYSLFLNDMPCVVHETPLAFTIEKIPISTMQKALFVCDIPEENVDKSLSAC